MAIWSNTVKTNAGMALDAKLAAQGLPLKIKSAKSGSGSVNPTLLKEQIAVTLPKQTLELKDAFVTGENTVNLPTSLSNEALDIGYALFQVGIYAEDPDDGDILYIIAQTSEESGELIPSKTEMPGFSIDWNFAVAVGDASTVQVTISEAGKLTMEQADARYAPINNAALTGIPTAPTASTDTNTTQIATTEFVHTLLDGQAISYLNATLLSTSWTGAEAPYTYDLTLEGITADSDGLITVADTATDEQYQAASAAMLRKTAQAENNLTIKAYGEKPAVDIPITVRLG